MDKEVIILILENKVITSDQLNNFIIDYVKDQINKDITGEELSGIIKALQMGFFNLRFAASAAAKKLDLNVINVYDANSRLLKSEVYE